MFLRMGTHNGGEAIGPSLQDSQATIQLDNDSRHIIVCNLKENTTITNDILLKVY